jgi:hypothetical protein
MGNRLYVGTLSFNTSSDPVREAFASLGEVTDVHLVTDRMTGQPRGFGGGGGGGAGGGRDRDRRNRW